MKSWHPLVSLAAVLKLVHRPALPSNLFHNDRSRNKSDTSQTLYRIAYVHVMNGSLQRLIPPLLSEFVTRKETENALDPNSSGRQFSTGRMILYDNFDYVRFKEILRPRPRLLQTQSHSLFRFWRFSMQSPRFRSRMEGSWVVQPQRRRIRICYQKSICLKNLFRVCPFKLS